MRKTSRKPKKDSSSWKSFRFFKRVKKLLKLFIFSIFAVTASGLIIAGIYFYKYIKSPLAESNRIENTKEFDTSSPFSISFIVLDSLELEAPKITKLYFIAHGTFNEKSVIYSIPVDNSISRVYSLGNLTQKNSGVKFTNKTVEKIFAKKPDRFILTDEEGLQKAKKLFDAYDLAQIKNIGNISNLTNLGDVFNIINGSFKTNLTLTEMYKLVSLLRKTEIADIKFKKLTTEEINDSFTIDTQMETLFTDSKIADEQKRVLILNAAGVEKLGYAVSRLVQNRGGFVVNITNSPKVFNNSFIVSSDLTSTTLAEISYETGIREVVGPEELNTLGLSDIKGYGADIVIVAGIDYADGL